MRKWVSVVIFCFGLFAPSTLPAQSIYLDIPTIAGQGATPGFP